MSSILQQLFSIHNIHLCLQRLYILGLSLAFNILLRHVVNKGEFTQIYRYSMDQVSQLASCKDKIILTVYLEAAK